MRVIRPIVAIVAILIAEALPPAAVAQEMPSDYAAALTALGRQGDFKDGVLRVGLPRRDLTVAIDGIRLPTPFGFSGWIAMTPGDHGTHVMMGDLVLTEDEVNPVMSALLDRGLEVTALHNHFFWESPRMFYMHVHGHGEAGDLARRVKPALDLMGTVSSRAAAAATGAPLPAGTLDHVRLAEIVGQEGETTGDVYKITVGRPDIDLRQMGARINSRMGLNTWAAFTGGDQMAVVAGDVAMLEQEVTPVLTAMRRYGLDIVAIHHHMTGSRPVVIFLHYYGKGPAGELARGVRAALDELGKHGPPAPRVRETARPCSRFLPAVYFLRSL